MSRPKGLIQDPSAMYYQSFPENDYEPRCQWEAVNKFLFLLGLCTLFSFPIKLGFFQPANFHTFIILIHP